ncbi:hypothetical protein MMPV_004677 [Pyropia vietnamensis]
MAHGSATLNPPPPPSALLLSRLLLPAVACLLGVLLGTALPPHRGVGDGGVGHAAATAGGSYVGGHGGGSGGRPIGGAGAPARVSRPAAVATTTTAIADGFSGSGGVAHLRPPSSAAALAAVPSARVLGVRDPRLSRVLLSAGSLPHMSAGVEVVAAGAAIPPHTHEVGEVLFFWRGAGGGGAAAATPAATAADTTANGDTAVADTTANGDTPAADTTANGETAAADAAGAGFPVADDGTERESPRGSFLPPRVSGGGVGSTTAVATVGGRRIRLADGDVLVIPAGVDHTVAASVAAELWLVWVLGEPDFAFQTTYSPRGTPAPG